eukprot:m.124207 g.124207  ORF g.124207 m.124207 type:complete len:328 (+) comp19730_c3_seq1:324-1307(+)
MKKVCVTGASGFIASELVAQLLSKGYTVVGTVRSLTNEDAIGHLKQLPGAADRLQLVEADLLKEGSFDNAVSGCEGVFHTASPFFRRECKPEELITPAVQGTLNVYHACQRTPTVKRVVTTSSFATIIFGHDHTKDPEPYTEKDWNSVSRADSADTMHIYRVSKTEAEKAGWRLLQEEKPHFDIVTINPPLVLGPWLPGYRRPNESSMIFAELLNGEKSSVGSGGMGMIDVRDLAAAHILALENAAAEGRNLVATASFSWEEINVMLLSLYPQYPIPLKRNSDNPVLFPRFDCSKFRALGWKPQHKVLDTLKAQCESLIEAGIVKKL